MTKRGERNRGHISLGEATYERMRRYCATRKISMAKFLEARIEEALRATESDEADVCDA